MSSIARTGWLACFALSLIGCASLGPDQARTTADLDVAGATQTMDVSQTSWEAYLADPGVPGEDYDPQRIVVSYFPAARLPAGMPAEQPAAGERAADMYNSLSMLNREYEPITDAIAARYGLQITNQVYWKKLNIAGFRLSEGVDGNTVLNQIRREFAGTVEFASYAMILRACVYSPNDPDFTKSTDIEYSELWSLYRIGCPQAWDYTRGSSTQKIAVVDTGVRVSHEELSAQVLEASEIPGKPTSTYLDVVNDDNTVEDSNGHGTFIAGQIAAEGNNGRTIVGAAYQCQVIPIKITNSGSAMDVDIIDGCVNGFNLGARVISLSFGDYHNDPYLEQLVDEVWNNGGIFIAASGNDNVTTPHYPSDYANAISVGSTDINDARSSFSNYGQYVDIAAPGEGIKSCDPSADNAYADWTNSAGTSFSCPLVAAAAALIWSYDPSLTNQEVRDLLLSTAEPTTGFTQGDVGRLDIGAALAELAGVHVVAPMPSQLIHSGTVTLTPEIEGEVERVDCYLNGVLIESRDSAPWTFAVDTGNIEYGYANIVFTGVNGADQASASMSLLVDNSFGSFPISENFEDSARDFYPIECKGYTLSLLQAIRSLSDGDWTLQDVQTGGAGAWNDESESPFEGYTSKYCGTGSSSYGAFEADALVSRKLDLSAVSQPTLVFHHHYNIEDGGSGFDRASVYVTADGGETFTLANLSGGGQARFSGMQSSWQTVQVDLSAFSGQMINIVLFLESDSAQAGENTSQPAGWWVDKLTVAMDYKENIPTIGGVSVVPYSDTGLVPDVTELNPQVSNPDRVAHVQFTLDLAPLGVVDSYDVTISDDSQPFGGVISIPGDVPNQLAYLQVYYYDESDVPGPPKLIPIYVFNQLGDTNADGTVDTQDLAGYVGQIGLTDADSSYIPFYDSNLDGTVTELDAAMVGYHFGESLP